MNRIEEIKERITEFRDAHDDISFLLSRLQIAEEALKKISTHGPDSDEMIYIAEQALEEMEGK